jgi:hypothetical protein
MTVTAEFVRSARYERGPAFYPLTTLKLSPVYAFGLFAPWWERRVAVLGLWIGGFYGGMTLLGVLGAGYQMRFVAPALPAASLMVGSALEADALGDVGAPLAALMVGYGTMHALYYGVMFTPLYADATLSVLDLLETILGYDSIFSADSPSRMRECFLAMQAFGLRVGLKGPA